MKVLKEESPIEKKVQQIESLMRELDISVEYRYGMYVHHNGKEYLIRDVECGSGEITTGFPRVFDTERLIVPE